MDNYQPTNQYRSQSSNNLTSSKKYLFAAIAIILFLVLAGLGFFAIANRNTPETSNTQTNENPLLATVGEEKIYKNDVMKLARIHYIPSAISDKVVMEYLEILIERTILDLEAMNLKINVTAQEIDSSKYKIQATQSGNTKSLDDFVRYRVLKDKIMASHVKSVEAYTIRFWIIPESTGANDPEILAQRAVTKSALNDAERLLKEGQSVVNATQYIYNQYPALQNILGVNGYNFGKLNDKSLLEKPKLYSFNQQDTKTLNDPDFYNTLSTMQKDEIRQIISNDGSGGSVIKVIKVNLGEFSNYDEFLQAKINQLVKKH